MKNKKIVFGAIVFLFVMSGFCSIINVVVAQSYDVIENVEPNDFRVFDVTYPLNELGEGWSNHLEFDLTINSSSVSFICVSEAGYLEFQNSSHSNVLLIFNDISDENIFLEEHHNNLYWLSRRVWTSNIQKLYMIIWNIADCDAEWEVSLHPLSNYNRPREPLISGYLIIIGIIIVGIVLTIVLVKRKKRKKREAEEPIYNLKSIYCVKCGAKITEITNSYCSNCGNKWQKS